MYRAAASSNNSYLHVGDVRSEGEIVTDSDYIDL